MKYFIFLSMSILSISAFSSSSDVCYELANQNAPIEVPRIICVKREILERTLYRDFGYIVQKRISVKIDNEKSFEFLRYKRVFATQDLSYAGFNGLVYGELPGQECVKVQMTVDDLVNNEKTLQGNAQVTARLMYNTDNCTGNLVPTFFKYVKLN